MSLAVYVPFVQDTVHAAAYGILNVHTPSSFFAESVRCGSVQVQAEPSGYVTVNVANGIANPVLFVAPSAI